MDDPRYPLPPAPSCFHPDQSFPPLPYFQPVTSEQNNYRTHGEIKTLQLLSRGFGGSPHSCSPILGTIRRTLLMSGIIVSVDGRSRAGEE